MLLLLNAIRNRRTQCFVTGALCGRNRPRRRRL